MFINDSAAPGLGLRKWAFVNGLEPCGEGCSVHCQASKARGKGLDLLAGIFQVCKIEGTEAPVTFACQRTSVLVPPWWGRRSWGTKVVHRDTEHKRACGRRL